MAHHHRRTLLIGQPFLIGAVLLADLRIAAPGSLDGQPQARVPVVLLSGSQTAARVYSSPPGEHGTDGPRQVWSKDFVADALFDGR